MKELEKAELEALRKLLARNNIELVLGMGEIVLMVDGKIVDREKIFDVYITCNGTQRNSEYLADVSKRIEKL